MKKKVKKADFQKTRLKVGRTLKKDVNLTRPTFKSRQLVVRAPELESRDAIEENLRRLTHHNAAMRLNAARALQKPDVVLPELAKLLAAVCPALRDSCPQVRQCLRKLLVAAVAKKSRAELGPHTDLLRAHLNLAMTSLNSDMHRETVTLIHELLPHEPAFWALCVSSGVLALARRSKDDKLLRLIASLLPALRRAADPAPLLAPLTLRGPGSCTLPSAKSFAFLQRVEAHANAPAAQLEEIALVESEIARVLVS